MVDKERLASTISKCAFCERKIPIDISHVYGYEDFEEIPTQNVCCLCGRKKRWKKDEACESCLKQNVRGVLIK